MSYVHFQIGMDDITDSAQKAMDLLEKQLLDIQRKHSMRQSNTTNTNPGLAASASDHQRKMSTGKRVFNQWKAKTKMRAMNRYRVAQKKRTPFHVSGISRLLVLAGFQWLKSNL